MTQIIPIAVEVAAGADTFVELYTVEDAKVRIKEIELHFPAGAMNYVFLSLYYGNMKKAPRTGEWTGDNGKIKDFPDITYYRGDTILLRARNTHTTDSFKVWGTLELEKVG